MRSLLIVFALLYAFIALDLRTEALRLNGAVVTGGSYRRPQQPPSTPSRPVRRLQPSNDWSVVALDPFHPLYFSPDGELLVDSGLGGLSCDVAEILDPIALAKCRSGSLGHSSHLRRLTGFPDPPSSAAGADTKKTEGVLDFFFGKNRNSVSTSEQLQSARMLPQAMQSETHYIPSNQQQIGFQQVQQKQQQQVQNSQNAGLLQGLLGNGAGLAEKGKGGVARVGEAVGNAVGLIPGVKQVVSKFVANGGNGRLGGLGVNANIGSKNIGTESIGNGGIIRGMRDLIFGVPTPAPRLFERIFGGNRLFG